MTDQIHTINLYEEYDKICCLYRTMGERYQALRESHDRLLQAIGKVMTISAHMQSKSSSDINKICSDIYTEAKKLQEGK